MKWLTNLFNRRQGFPKRYKNVWYNFHVYDREKYPVVFNDDGKYIECQIGQVVQMGVTEGGERVYYRVTQLWHTRGSDWLYSSDSINCDLIFSHIAK